MRKTYTEKTAMEVEEGREQFNTNRDYHFSVSNMDPKMIPEGFQYSLEPLRVRDRSLRHNMERAFRLGWQPVERSSHPQWALPDELESLLRDGESQHKHSYIIDRDRMLMRMPIYKYQELIGIYNNNAQEQRDRISKGLNFGNDPEGMYRRGSVSMEASYQSGHAALTNPTFRDGNIRNSFGS